MSRGLGTNIQYRLNWKMEPVIWKSLVNLQNLRVICLNAKAWYIQRHGALLNKRALYGLEGQLSLQSTLSSLILAILKVYHAFAFKPITLKFGKFSNFSSSSCPFPFKGNRALNGLEGQLSLQSTLSSLILAILKVYHAFAFKPITLKFGKFSNF